MNLSCHPRFLPRLLLALAAGSTSVVAADLGSARSAYAEWARVQTQISEERSEWRREQALLNDTLGAARAELLVLDERIAELQASATEADQKRGELVAGVDESKATAAAVTTKIAAAESALRALVPLLPPPLLSELQPLMQRLPAEGARTSLPLGQRVQTIAVALSQIEKFNAGFNLVSEIRELGGGRSVEVKTLYVGLATAYFADAAGSTTGIGRPGATGWEWTPADAEMSARIAQAIAIQENTQPPAFVSLPVSVR